MNVVLTDVCLLSFHIEIAASGSHEPDFDVFCIFLQTSCWFNFIMFKKNSSVKRATYRCCEKESHTDIILRGSCTHSSSSQGFGEHHSLFPVSTSKQLSGWITYTVTGTGTTFACNQRGTLSRVWKLTVKKEWKLRGRVKYVMTLDMGWKWHLNSIGDLMVNLKKMTLG